MKKINLLVIILLAAGQMFSQSQRLVMFEEFTQASCPPCAAANPSLNLMLDAHPDQVVSVKYQTSWPGVDPMNAQNPTPVATRVSYYAVTGVPDGELDGGLGFSGQPAGMTYANVSARYAVPSDFNIAVDFHLSGASDSIYCHARIYCTLAVSAPMVAHTAVIERNVYFNTEPGTNGEKTFEGVMKQMLPSASGFTMPSSWAVGDSLDINYAWKLANVYDINQLGVVVFLQNPGTKEVYQAGYARPHIQYDAGVTALTSLPAVQCTPDVNPQVTVENYGIDPLTSVDINYYFDTNAPSTYSWTGNLAGNASTVVTLPTMSPGVGGHVLHVSTNNPNASVDQNTHNDATSRGIAIYTASASSPIVEAFATTTFPPDNFAVDNVDQDADTWMYSPYGHNGAGSAKIPFYSAADATIDYLYIPKVDFSNAIIGSQLTFDVAHAQYAAGDADRLQVNVSTNCGSTWTTVYDKQGAALATAAITTTAYNPAASGWRNETVSLDAFIGASDLLVRFKGISNYGNNAYVDNVNLSDGIISVPMILTKAGIKLYPNPAKGEAYLSMDLNRTSDVNVMIIDALGSVVKSFNYTSVSSQVAKLDLTGLAIGNYIVKIQAGSDSVNERLNITE